MKTFFVALAGLGLIVGCGGSSDAGGPAQPAPADTAPTDPAAAVPADPPLDHGAPSDKYPAFTPDMGQLTNSGGQVLKDPVIVTVTWPSEPNVDTFEQFGDSIGPSKYWKTVTSEYGVGTGVSGSTNHVRMTEAAPQSISDTDLATFVQTHLTATDATAWPAPASGDPVYILYLPTATNLLLQGKGACAQGVGGYHDSVAVNGKSVAYAIVPQCGTLDESTLSASHELAEAATDPYPRSAPAWSGFDDNHMAWEFFQQFQSENGDACEFYRDSGMRDSDVGFTVQRQWSNVSAAAGHSPCVPSPGGVYFNVTPLDLEDVDVDLSALGGMATTTKGFKVVIGDTKKIPLGFYSDGAAGPWKLKVQEGGIFGTSQKGKFDMSLDVEQGQNGQKAYLTLTAVTQGKIGGGIVTLVSTNDAGLSHYMPVMISTPTK